MEIASNVVYNRTVKYNFNKQSKELSVNYEFHDETMNSPVMFQNNCTVHRGLSSWYNPRPRGAVSIRKTVLPGMAIPMLKIRRPNGRLIFNIEIAIRR